MGIVYEAIDVDPAHVSYFHVLFCKLFVIICLCQNAESLLRDGFETTKILNPLRADLVPSYFCFHDEVKVVNQEDLNVRSTFIANSLDFYVNLFETFQ